ncbi:hypothetical protein [Halostagnicola bangensis]
MRSVLESDTKFYYAVGVLTIAVFILSIAAVTTLNSIRLGSQGLFGLLVGFGFFMLVFFVSIAIHRLEDLEDV